MAFPLCKTLVSLVFFLQAFAPSLCFPGNSLIPSFGSNSRYENFFNPLQIPCGICGHILFGTNSLNRHLETHFLQDDITFFSQEQRNHLPNNNRLRLFLSSHVSPSPTTPPPNQNNHFHVQHQLPQRNSLSSPNQPYISYQIPPLQGLSGWNSTRTITRPYQTQPFMQMPSTSSNQPFVSPISRRPLPGPVPGPSIRSTINILPAQQQVQPAARQIIMERRENGVPPNGHMMRPYRPQPAPDVIDLVDCDDEKSSSTDGSDDIDLRLRI